MIQKLIRFTTTSIFILIGVSLFILSVGLIVSSLWAVIEDAISGQFDVLGLLNKVSQIVISAAVLDLGKFFLEEEVVRGHDLRQVREVRASVTKFMTIILIAMSLESLVMVFEVATSDDFSQIVYPVTLFVATIFLIIAIGIFQWLTSDVQKSRQRDNQPDTRPDTRPDEQEDGS